jgi:hypothetical protein
VFFPKNTPKRPFLVQEALLNVFSFFCTFNHKILPYTTTRTCPKSFPKVDRTDCEIITFEVQRKVFFHCARQGQQTFDCSWCKIFQPCNRQGQQTFDCSWCKKFQPCDFEVLHHHNAHHVRYLCAKSYK